MKGLGKRSRPMEPNRSRTENRTRSSETPKTEDREPTDEDETEDHPTQGPKVNPSICHVTSPLTDGSDSRPYLAGWLCAYVRPQSGRAGQVRPGDAEANRNRGA